MKAIILVGGEGTRLRPLTCNIPKAMVPVLNAPFLEHVLRFLSTHKVKGAILAQGYLSQSIESYFGDGHRLGIRLDYASEAVPMGTAGAVKNAQVHLDEETFLVLNGDIFTDLDVTALIAFHRARKAKATIALTPVEDPTNYGLVETDAQGRVTRFVEKPGRNELTINTINAGIYVLDPEVLSYIPSQASFSFERELFPLLLEREEPVYAYSAPAYWIDTGSPERYLQLNRDLLNGKSSQYAPRGQVLVGARSSVHPTAQMTGPILIGSNCIIEGNVKLRGPVVIGSGCTIRADSVIEESVIWRNVLLGSGVSLRNSIVADNCCLNAKSIIHGSVLGDKVIVNKGCRLGPGNRIQPETIVTAPHKSRETNPS